MKLHLLGTGGADGIPAFYSGSRVSRWAREHGGKDVRTRAAALVDDGIKIDLGPDTWGQVVRAGLDARDWTALLFTHSDADHFAIDELQYGVYPFNDMEYVGFTIYANSVVCRAILEKYPDWPFEVVMTQSFIPFDHGGTRVTPVRAYHKSEEDAHNFVIQDGRSTLLYATDTGVWREPTWEALSDFRLDALVLECSDGVVPSGYDGHLNVKDFLMVLERLRKQGTVHDGTRVVTTHHSHNGDATHEELEAIFSPHGVAVGFDSLIMNF